MTQNAIQNWISGFATLRGILV